MAEPQYEFEKLSSASALKTLPKQLSLSVTSHFFNKFDPGCHRKCCKIS
jgi:hypothetical protein